MDLYLHESVLLLGIDDEKGKYTTASAYVNYGFSAALLLDLILIERIAIEEERVRLKTNAITENKLLNDVLRLLQEKQKNRKVVEWLHDLALRSAKLIPIAIEGLIHRKILERKEGKILWVFKVDRYPSIDTGPENELRARLHQIIFENGEPGIHDRMLLSLLLACGMQKQLIPDETRHFAAKERIAELTEENEMRTLVGNAIEEMQILLMATTSAVL